MMSQYSLPTLFVVLCLTAHSYAQDFFFQGTQPDSAMSKLEKAWLDADDDDRERISEKTYALLEKQFAKDMQRREKELEQVEARIRRLRKQLAKREDKKDEIISLQLKQVTMAWEGLGWTEPQNARLKQLYSRGMAQTPMALKALATTLPGPESKGRKLVEQIIESTVRGDDDAQLELATELAESAEGIDAVLANDMIWSVYEEVGDQIENNDFWVALGKSAEEAADQVDADADPRTAGNILDTAAHCYDLGGKTKKAVKLQRKAVEYSAAANDGSPDNAILEFLSEIDEESAAEWTNEWEDDEDEDEDKNDGAVLR